MRAAPSWGGGLMTSKVERGGCSRCGRRLAMHEWRPKVPHLAGLWDELEPTEATVHQEPARLATCWRWAGGPTRLEVEEELCPSAGPAQAAPSVRCGRSMPSRASLECRALGLLAPRGRLRWGLYGQAVSHAPAWARAHS